MAKDILTPVAVVGGIAAAALGVYYMKKKPKGVKQGSKILATAFVQHVGQPQSCYLEYEFGHIRPLGIFDSVEGLLWSHDIDFEYDDQWIEYITIFDLSLPSGIAPEVYDSNVVLKDKKTGHIVLQGPKTKGAINITEVT